MVRARRRNVAKGNFDPNDEKRVKHTQLGVWEVYEEIEPNVQRIPGASKLESFWEIYQTLPYVWRMLKDVGSIKNCWLLLFFHLSATFVEALVPATALWYSGQLLKIVESAVETRTVDTKILLQVAGGRVACAIANRFANYTKNRVKIPLQQRIKAHYARHIFAAYSRLDVPTFDDNLTQAKLNAATSNNSSVAWSTMQRLIYTAATILRLVSQISVLIGVVHAQQDGFLIAALCCVSPILKYLQNQGFWTRGVWAATCKNEDYLKMQGMKYAVVRDKHRKELVAGDMSDHVISEFRDAQERLGDDAGEFFELKNAQLLKDGLFSLTLLSEPFNEIPQVFFTLRAVQRPASIPISLASLNLIQYTVSGFTQHVLSLFQEFGSVAENLDSLRKLYDITAIPNQVFDGHIPFPEDQRAIANGVSIEFRNVSFRYPGNHDYALDNVSFKIERGQLCLILGDNGSGKSTMLKLIARLYDPAEGQILLDDHDIRTLKLSDLRRATSVLFQDYTHFPVSIKDNIGLGDPAHARCMDRIEEAARLGGAHDFITRLPDGFGTFIDRPVQDCYSALPEGTKTLFGRTVDFSKVRKYGALATANVQLSGGQMQRLAVSRSFMRSLGPDTQVGLLLFDEPSASLDPVAEHDLFERLRELRGHKTMIFSSHRFGNLTRHADLIICMKDSRVIEMGTHKSLLQAEEGYARIYTLQAQAFLP